MADLIDRAPKRIWIEDPDEKTPYFYEESELCEVSASVVEYVRADLAALPAQGVRVKPLEWEKHPTAQVWRCDTFIGTYKVFGVGPTPSWDFDGLDVEGITLSTSATAPTLDAAKAAAQADYEARILAALAPAEAGGVEAHDEQLAVWADELMADLALNSFMELVDYEYDTKVGARRMIIDALKAANQAKVPQPDNDPPCTDCGGTGITYQTERRCACQPSAPDAQPDGPATIYLTEVDYEDTDFPLVWASASADSGGLPYHRAAPVDALVKAAEALVKEHLRETRADEADATKFPVRIGHVRALAAALAAYRGEKP